MSLNRTTYNHDARKALSQFHYENYNDCCLCALRLVCKGGCPLRRFNEKGFSVGKSVHTCTVCKTMIPQVLSSMALDSRYDNIIFDNTEVVRL